MLGPFEGPSFSVVFHSELLHLALIRTLQLLCIVHQGYTCRGQQ